MSRVYPIPVGDTRDFTGALPATRTGAWRDTAYSVPFVDGTTDIVGVVKVDEVTLASGLPVHVEIGLYDPTGDGDYGGGADFSPPSGGSGDPFNFKLLIFHGNSENAISASEPLPSMPCWLRVVLHAMTDPSFSSITVEMWTNDPDSGGSPVQDYIWTPLPPSPLPAAANGTAYAYVGGSGPGADAVVGPYSWDPGFPAVQPSTIAVGANPKAIPADGSSTSDVTAHVRDHTGAGLPGLSVAFTPSAHFGGVVNDNGDGTYDTMFTSDTSPGSVEVQAATGSLRASTSIRQWSEQGDLHAGPHKVGILRP